MEERFSFCISTFKRPDYIKKQIESLLSQTYKNFEIVISDNDPNASARKVCEAFDNNRVKYFHNEENLGMILSFNKSIERASNPYIIMVTDDDPIEKEFLYEIVPHIKANPALSAYCAFRRHNRKAGEVELIGKEYFASEILNIKKTPHIFWSSCVLRKDDVIKMGMLPMYGSPHLMDHALMAITGSINGGLIINSSYSTHNPHEASYSGANFDSYYIGCVGFYNFISKWFSDWESNDALRKSVQIHLKSWIISMSMKLQKEFYKGKQQDKLNSIRLITEKIMTLDFMENARVWFFFKQKIFRIKAMLGLL